VGKFGHFAPFGQAGTGKIMLVIPLAFSGHPIFSMSDTVRVSRPAVFPSWQVEVQDAVSEANPEKLLGRVHAAEIAIFNRLQELGKDGTNDGHHHSERESLGEALEKLRLLKRDRLGFPDWTQKR
jgi:hypothetical protein